REQADHSLAAWRGEEGQCVPARRRSARGAEAAHEGRRRRRCVRRAARTQEQVLMLSAADIIARLELRPHPEGGYYRETFCDKRVDANGRAQSTAIYYLLARGDRSHWHRIDAVEIWHYYAGAALMLQTAHDGCAPHTVKLGGDLAAGERPQAIVPAGAWQCA